MREWSVDEIYDMVIEGSDTDMIVAQPLPLTDLFHDGLSPWEKCAEMAQKHPDRAVFWGSVNPLEGKKALDLMRRQVEDYGAKAFKFYNVRYDYGQPFPWRMDDPRVAYPVLRARPGAGRQPDRRAQGRPARPAADRAHAHVRHGRRGGELPRHQLRHLPRRPAVARRGAVADRPLPEPLRVDRRDGQLHRPPAAGLRRDAREDALVVRRGQDHLRRRVADLAPAVGARGVLELRAARATSSRSAATRSSPTRPSARSSARTSPACTASTSRRRRPSSGCRPDRRRRGRLRAAVVGATGFIGPVHVRSARLAGAEVVGVAASSPERAREAADRLGVPHAYGSSEEAVAADGVDVVHICTPNDLHGPLAAAALAAGKHVVCEKPLATTAAEAEQVLDAAERDGPRRDRAVRLPLQRDGVRGPGARRGGRDRHRAPRPRRLPAGLAVDARGRQLARRPAAQRRLARVRRHRLALVRPRRVRHGPADRGRVRADRDRRARARGPRERPGVRRARSDPPTAARAGRS